MARSQDEGGDGGNGNGGDSMTPSGSGNSWTYSPLPPGWTRDPDGTIHGPGGGTFSSSGTTVTNPWPTGVDPTTALISTLNNGTMGYGDNYVTGFNKQYGLQPGSSLAYYGDTNTYALPSGYAAIGADGMWGWNPRTGGNTGPVTTQPVPGSLAQLPTAAASSAVSGGPGTGANAQALFDFIMGRAQQSTNIDPNDPVIKAQVDAAAAKGINTWRNIASSEAEKGGANYNPEAQNRSIGEQLGQSISSLQASLMAQELQSRRQDVQNMIAQGASLLTSEQQLQLEDELTKLDEQIRLTGLDMSNDQFAKSLAERSFEFDASNANSVLGA